METETQRDARFTIRLSPKERTRLREIADEEFNTPSGVLRRFINQGLKSYEASDAAA